MIPPSIPSDEEARLAALRALELLDTAPEREFDDIVEIARALFGAPIALITLVDGHRQWFKARAGLDAEETPRDVSFCAHAIHRDEVMLVRDAREDPRFHDHPAVLESPHIRFYAGAPLKLPGGHRIGTMCVAGSEPRAGFGPRESDLLARLGRLTLDAIALRAARARFGRKAETR